MARVYRKCVEAVVYFYVFFVPCLHSIPSPISPLWCCPTLITRPKTAVTVTNTDLKTRQALLREAGPDESTAKRKQLYLFTPPQFITETIKGIILFKGANKALPAIFRPRFLSRTRRGRCKDCFLYRRYYCVWLPLSYPTKSQ